MPPALAGKFLQQVLAATGIPETGGAEHGE
jgi:hypothetical protein